MPKRSTTVCWIRSTEISGISPCGKTSFSTSWASSTVIGRPVSDEKATTRVSAPSSSRMFVEIRLAMKVSTCGSGTWIPSVFTFLRRIAMRVSRSGGWMSVIRPHSKRERSRASSVAIVARRPVGRDHDLPAGLVERVEGVEELLLDPLLALEELDVVDQEDVVVAVALLEALDPLVAERVDEVVHERLARDVAGGEVAGVLGHVGGDRLEEVGLAEAGAAVDEERVVGLRRRLGDRERGRVGEAVRRADHEESKVYLGFRPSSGVPAAAGRGARRAGALPELAHDDAHAALLAEHVADGRLDEAEEVALDPLAREVVRDDDDERLERRARRPASANHVGTSCR